MLKYNDCLLQLRKRKSEVNPDGLDIIIKNVPESKEPGTLDPRQVLWTKLCMEASPVHIRDIKNPTYLEIDAVRKSMGCKNKDLSKNVSVKKTIIDGVDVEVYRPANCEKKCPVTIYIHGGGFIGGSIDVVRNSCKLLAERASSVVISVDYKLAPENIFPYALNQCYKVIEWVYSNGEGFGIDSSKIIVAGDSAGGNLAAACCLKDEKKMISLQILLYPVVNLNPYDPDWTEDVYCVKDEPEIARQMIYDIKSILELCSNTYVEDPLCFKNPLASPYFAEKPSVFPTTFIVSPEYDYLRRQAELFSSLLSENGVDVVLFRYKGMAHAFFEHPGEFPQAEDCINEIASAIMAL
ncbi:MAG: alpha/beta hydrolase [Spirochaetales bacterium]|nr:alpha/beta hydrolase [Spirochaetales bacterium]